MKSHFTRSAFVFATALLLAATAHLRAADLPIPDGVAFERDIEFSNPDNQHLQVNLAQPKDGAAGRSR